MIQKLQQSIEAFTHKLSQSKFSSKLSQPFPIKKIKASSISKYTLNKFQHTLKFFANTTLQQSIALYFHQTLTIQSTLCLQEFKSITKEISFKEHRQILETLQKFLLNFDLDQEQSKIQLSILNRKFFSLQNIISTMPKVKKLIVQCLIFLLYIKKNIAQKSYKHIYDAFLDKKILQKLQNISPSQVEFCGLLKAKIYSCVAIIALQYKQKSNLQILICLGIEQRRKAQTLFRKYDESYVSVTFYLILKYIKYKLEETDYNSCEIQIILNRQLKFCEKMKFTNKYKQLYISKIMEAKEFIEKNKKIQACEDNYNQNVPVRRVLSQNNHAYNFKTKSLTRKNQEKVQIKPQRNIKFNQDLAYRVEIYLQLQNLKTVDTAPSQKQAKPHGKVFKKKKAPNVYRNFKLNKQILQISFQKLSKQLRKFGNIQIPRKQKIRKEFQQYITNFEINYVEKQSREILLDENSYNKVSFVKIWSEKPRLVQLQLITDQPQFHLIYKQNQEFYNIVLQRSSHVLCERFITFWPTIKYLFRKKISQIKELNAFEQHIFSKKHRKNQEKNSSAIQEKIFKNMDYQQREDISTFCSDVFKFVNLLLAPKNNCLDIILSRKRDQQTKKQNYNQLSSINDVRFAINSQRIHKIHLCQFTLFCQDQFYQIDVGITMSSLQSIIQTINLSSIKVEIIFTQYSTSQKLQFNLPLKKLQKFMINSIFLSRNLIDIIKSSLMKRSFLIRMIRAFSCILQIRKNVGPTVCISNNYKLDAIEQNRIFISQHDGFGTYPISIHQNYSNIMRRLQNSIQLKAESKWKILRKKLQYCIPFLAMTSQINIRKTVCLQKQNQEHKTQTNQKQLQPNIIFSRVKQILLKKQTRKEYFIKFKLKSQKLEAKIIICIPRSFCSDGWTINYQIYQQNNSVYSQISFGKEDLQFLEIDKKQFNLIEFSNELLQFLYFFRQKFYYTLYFKIDNLMLKPLNKKLITFKENIFDGHKLQLYQPNEITIVSTPCRILNKFCMVVLTVILLKNLCFWELRIQRLFEGSCMVCKLNYEEVQALLLWSFPENILTNETLIRQVINSRSIRQKFSCLFKSLILPLNFQQINKFQLRTKLKDQYKIFNKRIIKKNDAKNDSIYEVIKFDYQDNEYLSVNKTTTQECSIMRKIKICQVLRQYQVQQGPERMNKCSRRQIKTYCQYFLNKTLQQR